MKKDEYGLKLHPDRYVYDLSMGERQRIEIVRCLLQDPKLLILDEPTSVLTPQESDVLFETLRKLVSEGRSILYISHKLEEVKQENNKNPVPRRGLALTPVKFGISFTTLHQEYPDHSQSNPGGMNLGRAYHLNWARYWPTSDTS